MNIGNNEISFDFLRNSKQVRLSQIASPNARIGWQNLRRSEFKDEGDVYIITGTDFINGTVNLKTCQYVDTPRYEMDDKIKIHENDILITKDGTIGKVAIVKGLDKKATLNAGVFVLNNISKDVDRMYLYHYLRSPYLLNFINSQSTGGTILHLNQSVLLNFPVQLPEFHIQKKIAEFFTALDEKIRIHEQKLTKLISAKDSILLKLFKQEIRLKDKDGSDFHPWIKVKIGDILKVKHGKDYKHLSPGKIPVMATSGAISYVDTALCTWPCALIGRKGTIDKPQFMDKPFWCIDTLFYTKALGNHSPLFQYYLFQTIDWNKFNEGTGLPSLSASTIESIQCSIPMEKEQQEIANFLRIYDEKVKICTKKIEALKQLKKAFMQRMFV